MRAARGETVLVIPVPATHDRWTLDEEDMPETPLHGRIIELLVAILRCWVLKFAPAAMTGSNIAIRFDRAHPSRGVDPDVYLVDPGPPRGERETSLCLWKKGHHPPRLAVEVVSESTAAKDYHDAPARYAACGVRELWVFDPLGFGAPDADGPWTLQVWRATGKGEFQRVYAGNGPAFSRELAAWVVVTDGGMRLRIANDAAGTRLWPTPEEEQAALAEDRAKALADKDAALADKDAALAEREAEIARLRAQLAAKSGTRA